MKKRAILTVIGLLLAGGAAAQYVPLMREGRRALLFDLDAVWRYNLYEHSRWGAGLRYTLSDSVVLTVSAGYGLADRQWKGSVGGSVKLSANHRAGTLYGVLAREYSAAGSLRMSGWRVADIGGLASVMDRRMCDQLSALAGYRWHTKGWHYSFDARLFASQRLFDNNGMLFLKANDTLVQEHGIETRLHTETSWGLTAELLGGAVWPGPRPVAQLLVQWELSQPVGPFVCQWLLQGGAVPRGVPYPYMFDLGGTWGAPLHFRHTLLTARPNEFTASLFTFASLQVAFREPLLQWWYPLLQVGSYPRPFVGVNAVWGHLWDQTQKGRLQWEGMELQTPLYGLAEPVAGVEGLVRWGVADWGMAVAYRLAPAAAPYCLASPRDNLALLVTAKFIF